MGLPMIPLADQDFHSLKNRGISQKTCEKWKYGVSTYKGKPCQVANFFDETGQLIAQKVRLANKEFKILGDGKKLPLYGKWLWKDGGKRVVITEGEIDALSMSQVQDLKWPVLSLPSGAQEAAKVFKREVEYLEQFDTVVLMFDSDEPGIQASRAAAEVLSPGKVRIATLPLKDANEMLVSGSVKELTQAMWDAKQYRLDGVLSVSDLEERVDRVPEEGLSYPWEPLTKMTYGIRTAELIGLGAGTGMGKTEVFKEIACHLIKEHKQNVGMVMLEETPEHTLKGVMGKWFDKRFHVPNGEWAQDELKEAYRVFKKHDSLYLYDHFGHTDYETIKSTLRYLSVACGCRYLFLDHITALVSGDVDCDERRQLDYIMTDLASMCRELDITIFFISHLTSPEGKSHEEGGRVTLKQLRGSRAIGQWASFVFGLERDQQASEEERGISTFRCLKDRFTGEATGKTFLMGYNHQTGRLSEHTEEFNTEEDELL